MGFKEWLIGFCEKRTLACIVGYPGWLREIRFPQWVLWFRVTKWLIDRWR